MAAVSDNPKVMEAEQLLLLMRTELGAAWREATEGKLILLRGNALAVREKKEWKVK